MHPQETKTRIDQERRKKEHPLYSRIHEGGSPLLSGMKNREIPLLIIAVLQRLIHTDGIDIL